MLSMSEEVYLGRNPPGHQDVLGLTSWKAALQRTQGSWYFCFLFVECICASLSWLA